MQQRSEDTVTSNSSDLHQRQCLYVKTKGKGRDRKELRQYHGFPKDCNNSVMDGFRRDESRLLKDQENKVLEQKFKKSKG